jgi:hypothetical protein
VVEAMVANHNTTVDVSVVVYGQVANAADSVTCDFLTVERL